MLKRTFKLLKSVNGSAIIIALVTTVVLATLALAIISLTMGNLSLSQADALNNDAYYAAESGVNSALEQLKGEVLDYYHDMLNASSTQYKTYYDNFFAGIKTNAQTDFKEPLFKDLITQTTFTTGVFDSSNNVCEFLISCTATAPDDSQYRVDAKLYVKRLDVKKPSWLTLDDVAYKIGGTLNLNAGYGVYNGGSVITGAFNNPKNVYYSVQPPGKFLIDPNVTNTINDTLTYPSYITPSIAELEARIKEVNPSKGYEIKTYTSDVTLGYNAFSTTKPVLIIADKNLTITSQTSIFPGSIVYCKGNLNFYPNCSSTPPPVTCYCDGTVTTSAGPVYANIFCRGNVSTSGNFHGYIICDSNCTNACDTFVGTIIVNGYLNCQGGLTGSFFAGGALSINRGVSGNSVIYSKTKITLGNGNYANAVLFSGGNIDINGGSSLTGAVLAKGSVNQNAWLTLSYSRTAIDTIMKDPNNAFFFAGQGGGEMEDDENIIIDQEITAIGRQN